MVIFKLLTLLLDEEEHFWTHLHVEKPWTHRQDGQPIGQIEASRRKLQKLQKFAAWNQKQETAGFAGDAPESKEAVSTEDNSCGDRMLPKQGQEERQQMAEVVAISRMETLPSQVGKHKTYTQKRLTWVFFDGGCTSSPGGVRQFVAASRTPPKKEKQFVFCWGQRRLRAAGHLKNRRRRRRRSVSRRKWS